MVTPHKSCVWTLNPSSITYPSQYLLKGKHPTPQGRGNHHHTGENLDLEGIVYEPQREPLAAWPIVRELWLKYGKPAPKGSKLARYELTLSALDSGFVPCRPHTRRTKIWTCLEKPSWVSSFQILTGAGHKVRAQARTAQHKTSVGSLSRHSTESLARGAIEHS